MYQTHTLKRGVLGFRSSTEEGCPALRRYHTHTQRMSLAPKEACVSHAYTDQGCPALRSSCITQAYSVGVLGSQIGSVPDMLETLSVCYIYIFFFHLIKLVVSWWGRVQHTPDKVAVVMVKHFYGITQTSLYCWVIAKVPESFIVHKDVQLLSGTMHSLEWCNSVMAVMHLE